MIANPFVNLAHLALIDWTQKEEKARQRAIARARQYYEGEQLTYLSARLKEILDLDKTSAVSEDLLFHLNICDKVVTASVERLSVTSFKSSDARGLALGDTGAEDAPATGRGGAPGEKGQGAQAAWAASVWQSNRMDSQQWNLYEMVRRDGEAFVIVDYPEGADVPRFTLHQRFVSTDNYGDGYGCKAVYPNDDPSQPMRFAIKRWTEEYNADDPEAMRGWTDDQRQARKRQRMTLYFPDHLEKYALDRGQWMPVVDKGEVANERGWIAWVDSAGEGLGIPVIHFQNRGLRCEVDSSVIAMQNLLNKTLVDLAESADQTAYRILVALGFVPTADGQALKADGSNRVKLKPNTIIGTTRTTAEADMKPIAAESPEPLVTLVEKIMRWVALAKDIPLSRFQFTEQVAAEGTQKQMDAPLLALVRQLQVSLGDAWEDALYIGRRLANTFGSAGLDETVELETEWANPAVRSDDRDDPVSWWQAAGVAVGQCGVPFQVYARRMGWTEAELAQLEGPTVDAAGKVIAQ